jgi:hypothetical protein
MEDKIIECPCGKNCQGDFLSEFKYDKDNNIIGFICVHGEFINFGE